MSVSTVHASMLRSDTLSGGAYFLQGTDAYWLASAQKTFRSLLPEDSLSLRVVTVAYDVREIFSALDTMSFDSERTVVLVSETVAPVMDEKSHKLLQSFLSSDLSPNILVFCGCAFLNAAEIKLCSVISCAPLTKDECAPYASTLFPGGIDRLALQKLTSFCLYDMSRIRCEAQKLNAYTLNGTVTADDVEELVVEDTETQVFNFTNSIAEGKNALAEKQLNRLLVRGEKPAVLLALLTNQFRRMLYCSLSPLSDAELASVLGIKEYAVKKTRTVKTYSQTKLKLCVAMLTDYEYKFKSGQMTENTAFDRAVSKLLAKEVI